MARFFTSGREAGVTERVVLSIAYVAFAALLAAAAFAVEPLGWIAWPLAMAAAAGVPLSLYGRAFSAAQTLLAALAVAVILLLPFAPIGAQGCASAGKAAAPLRHV